MDRCARLGSASAGDYAGDVHSPKRTFAALQWILQENPPPLGVVRTEAAFSPLTFLPF
jgi:hypothetical protein